jgi:nucleotide-binding universal stress UspA family protein
MESTIFRKIMVATDGSEEVRKAVDLAIEISKLSNEKLYAAYVVALGGYSISPYSDPDLEKAMKEYLNNEGKKATAYVENIGRTANVEVESIILDGNPADEILKFAEKNDIDLIVMGTQGKSAIQRFIIGSVAENVIRHSKKSVLIVRGDDAKNNLLLKLIQIL